LISFGQANIGDIAHGYCIEAFCGYSAWRVIRLRTAGHGEFFLLTVLKKQTDRYWSDEADFLLEQMRFASEHFRHGNLQQVPLCGTFRDQRFFIVQECPYTLLQYIKASGGKLIAPIALHIVFQILDKLEFLHHIPAQEAGTERTCVTHDYLIPEHILLTDDGFAPTVKLSAQHKVICQFRNR
jgi:serine/threonine protein kinase